MPQNHHRRATLLFFEGWLGAAPSVVNAAIELCNRGYTVDLFSLNSDMNIPQPPLPPKVNLKEYSPFSRTTFRLARALFQRVKRAISKSNAMCRRLFNRAPFHLLNRVSHNSGTARDESTGHHSIRILEGISRLVKILEFGLFCRKHVVESDIVIAFDMTGLAVMAISRPKANSFIYWSLEILLLSETKEWVSRFLKRLEVRKVKTATIVVVQASNRLDLLAKDIDLTGIPVVFIPNGPRGRAPTAVAKTLFHRHFNIPESAIIVLHAGWISPTFLSLELAEASASWPAKYCLVFHEREERSSCGTIHQRGDSGRQGSSYTFSQAISFRSNRCSLRRSENWNIVLQRYRFQFCKYMGFVGKSCVLSPLGTTCRICL